MTRAYLQRLCNGQSTNPGIKALARFAHALQTPASAVFRLFLGSTQHSKPIQQSHFGLPLQQGGWGDEDTLAFVAGVSVPDHSVMMPNERFTKTWAIQNCGHVAWKDRFLERADERYSTCEKDASGRVGTLTPSPLNSLKNLVTTS